jgi:hypothetical protein
VGIGLIWNKAGGVVQLQACEVCASVIHKQNEHGGVAATSELAFCRYPVKISSRIRQLNSMRNDARSARSRRLTKKNFFEADILQAVLTTAILTSQRKSWHQCAEHTVKGLMYLPF